MRIAGRWPSDAARNQTGSRLARGDDEYKLWHSHVWPAAELPQKTAANDFSNNAISRLPAQGSQTSGATVPYSKR
jgi:hypothetical protein